MAARPTTTDVALVTVIVLAVIGVAFSLSGALGIVRMPVVYPDPVLVQDHHHGCPAGAAPGPPGCRRWVAWPGGRPWLAGAFTVGVVAIAGVPPLNGYPSVGLIHDALRSTGQWVPEVVMIIAQVLTIAALGRAAWEAFYRPRHDGGDFERNERVAAVVAALPVARWALSAGDNAVVARLRSIQNGSVNDYASYLVTGLLLTVALLALA